MQQGELYRVYRGNKNNSKDFRVFVIISRQTLIDSKFSTLICAPVYSRFDNLSTQVQVGPTEGLKTISCIFCDELVSIEKSRLTHFVGSLSHEKMDELEKAIQIAVGID